MKRIIFIFGLVLCGLNIWAQDEKVTFSHAGGFYENPFSLVLSNVNPQNTIRFTTNGNSPTAQSQLYSEPLTMDENLYSKSDIYTIQTAPEHLFYLPETVLHAIVIRAAVFDSNDECISDVFTNTYLINSLGCADDGLAVISVCADSLSLFDNETGIFVPGINWNPSDPELTGNYYQSGDLWERLINFEFYEPDDNSGVNQLCGLRTHGNRARRYAQKGMKIYAREEYGKKRFEHHFFETTPMFSFKHLIIKPYSSIYPFVGIQDYICSQMALHMNMETMNSRPVKVFINGEYWGIYFLQEKLDDQYLEDHFGIDNENCNVIESWHGTANAGSPDNFIAMINWLANADLSDQENYETITNLVDIDNFTDYIIFETFIGNKDWPANNMKCWQFGNGKWRWMFFDGDAALCDPDFDVFANATYTGPDWWPSNTESTLLFRKLLENQNYKNFFSQRLHELCESTFQYENTYPYYQEITAALRPEINNQIARFHNPTNLDSWNWGLTVIDDFLKDRVENYINAFDNSILLCRSNHSIPSFMCFPNPSDGEVFIRLDDSSISAAEIEIYDILGQEVFSKPCVLSDTGKQFSINPNLPAGVYFLKIGNHIQRIIRQ